jgi:hypothetical protein
MVAQKCFLFGALVALRSDLLSTKSLGGIGSTQELHGVGEPLGVSGLSQWKVVEKGRWNIMRPENVTVESSSHEFSNQIGHGNPEHITIMLANDCAKGTSENRQFTCKQGKMRFAANRSVSCPLNTMLLAPSSPSIRRASECATCNNH